MIVEPTALPGVLLLKPAVHRDARGRLHEAWRADACAALGIGPFVQDNITCSSAGVLRGLHFQHPGGQGKLVGVLHGRVLDVAVDVRRGSPTFGAWTALALDADTAWQLWIPPGFAHGFLACAEDVVVQYRCTAYYDPAAQRAIRWDDPDLGIDWPLRTPTLSPRDAAAPRLAALPPEALPPHDAGG